MWVFRTCGMFVGRGLSSLSFEGLLHFSVRRTLAMKIIRLALFFAAGMYLGVNAENFGDLQSVAETVGDVIERFRGLR